MDRKIVYGNARERIAPQRARVVRQRSPRHSPPGELQDSVSARQVQLALMQIACVASAAATLARQGLRDADDRTECLLQVLAFQLDGMGALADELASGQVGSGIADWLVGRAFASAGTDHARVGA